VKLRDINFNIDDGVSVRSGIRWKQNENIKMNESPLAIFCLNDFRL